MRHRLKGHSRWLCRMRHHVLLRCCILLLAASAAAATRVPGTQAQQPTIRPQSRGSRTQEVSTQAAAHHHSRKAGPQHLHGFDQHSNRASPNNAAAGAQPQQQQQQQQQQPAGALQQGAVNSRRLTGSQQPQLRVLDSRLLLLPGHDEFDPTAAVYMASSAQHQQDQQQASVLAAGEAEVTAAAPVVVAAVSKDPQLGTAAAGLNPSSAAAAARGAPVPREPTRAPSIRVQHQQQQQQQEVGDSESFMSEDDYSLASARAFGVHAVSQAAALSSGWAAADGSGPAAAADDTFHDDEAEAAAATAGSATQAVFEPQVLPAPVPKHPRLYATLPVPPASRSITGQAARAAARQALEAALQAAGTSPQGVTPFSGLTGLSLEDKLLLARLLGHRVVGDFDAAGRLDPYAPEYWALLDTQLEDSPDIKHMFEPTFYTCHKLLNPSLSLEQLEAHGDTHVLSWLGLREAQLPGPGEVADFDELVALLASVGARARLVTDPLPFLMTTAPPLGRDGIPLLIHMTLQHKGRLSRHHLISLASWASHNSEASILLYDDNDLEAYMRTFDASLLQLYTSLETGVERSDLWRYTVMCRHGGVYADVDTLCVKPVQEWNSQHGHDAEVLIGVEDVFRRDPSAAGASTGWGVTSGRFGVQFLQFTLAGAPGHHVFCRMPELIQQRVDDGFNDPLRQGPPRVDALNDWRILHRTGPHVWTDSVLQLMHNASIGWHEALVPGGRLVGDAVRVLPGTFLGCPAHLVSPSREGQQGPAAVLHFFRGGWRKHSNDATATNA